MNMLNTPQDQEHRILQAAVKCIESTSLMDFTMSAISKEAGLSMGSIYKYIQCKEDVLLALGCHAQNYFRQLAHNILQLPLPYAARVMAIQLVKEEDRYPYSFGLELVILLANKALLGRASLRWRTQYIDCGIAIEQLFRQHLQQACEQGELSADAATQDSLVSDIVNSIWALCLGHQLVAKQRHVRSMTQEIVPPDISSTIIRSLQRFLNTYAWREPLSDGLIEQACQELQRLGLR